MPPPRLVTIHGQPIGELDSQFWCDVHQRGLTYHEWKNGGCFWCDPSRIPNMQVPIGKDGKPVPSWDARMKVWSAIRDMTAEQRQELASRARGTNAAIQTRLAPPSQSAL
jgi:hypothetical protein